MSNWKQAARRQHTPPCRALLFIEGIYAAWAWVPSREGWRALSAIGSAKAEAPGCVVCDWRIVS